MIKKINSLKSNIENSFIKTQNLIVSSYFDKAFFTNDEEAQAFIESQGLKVKRIPLFKKPVTLHCAKGFNIEQYRKLETLKNEPFLWEITLSN